MAGKIHHLFGYKLEHEARGVCWGCDRPY